MSSKGFHSQHTQSKVLSKLEQPAWDRRAFADLALSEPSGIRSSAMKSLGKLWTWL